MFSVQRTEFKMFKDQISKTTMAAVFKLLAMMAAVKDIEGGRFNQSYVIFNIIFLIHGNTKRLRPGLVNIR